MTAIPFPLSILTTHEHIVTLTAANVVVTSAIMPIKSRQTTHNHCMECPSRLFQDETLLASQFSNPGNTSRYIGMLAQIVLPTPFPCDKVSPSAFKLTCCRCLLCLPFTLGIWMLLLLN
nr:hypothetical protein Iba_chr12eCG11380 [Ipomoea batatas]GMD72922.1 hypothetical protein Iba_chr12fCG13310 [Ipomoea batatas]